MFKGEGPSLSTFGVGGAMPNPAITAMSGSTAIASSDDWVNQPGASVISASGIAPKNNLEAAMVATLAEGAYTVIMRGVGSGGVGIIAVNELAAAAQLQWWVGNRYKRLLKTHFQWLKAFIGPNWVRQMDSPSPKRVIGIEPIRGHMFWQ